MFSLDNFNANPCITTFMLKFSTMAMDMKMFLEASNKRIWDLI